LVQVDALEACPRVLPPYLKIFFGFAYECGTRKGQLARTLRRFVELSHGVIVWPPSECKHREPHTLPLEGASLELVAQLMKKPPLWCPYLFHGPHCAPGRQVNRRYGCVGDFRRAWRTALLAAGLPVGRKAGGFVFTAPETRRRRTCAPAVWTKPTA
jgi:integrase